MSFMQKKIEKDFEYFVRALPALEPVEFFGLARILSVPTVRNSELSGFSKEEYENLKDSEVISAVITETLVPMDELLEAIMDKYLSLNKKRRSEINKILKDIKKSRKAR